MRWWRITKTNADLERELQSDLELEEEEQPDFLFGESTHQRNWYMYGVGSEPGLVQREVLTKTLRLALAGVALGTLGSFAFSKGIESLLFGTTPTDPAVFSGVSLLLCAVALVVAYVPVRRASRIDPMRALRTE